MIKPGPDAVADEGFCASHQSRECPLKSRYSIRNIADLAPTGSLLSTYDEDHAVTYVRLLDADAEGADWREVSRMVLRIDPDQEAERARRAFDSHLSRAKWVARVGYRQLLRGASTLRRVDR